MSKRNGHVEAEEEVSVAERGRRHLEGLPSNIGKWHCHNCAHDWTGHDKIRQCPKCSSPHLTHTPRPTITTGEPKDVEVAPPAEAQRLGTMFEMEPIAPANIVPSPFNPRKHFDQAKLEELADSFKKVGVLEPLIVRRGDGGKYELIAGERRWRASKIARLPVIPCRVLNVTDEEALEIQARENLDREDLDPIERAITFQQLLDKGGHTQETLAKRFKVSQELVSNAVRLLKLPDSIQQRIITREMSPTHARDLLPWTDIPKVMEEVGKVKEIGSSREWRRMVLNAVDAASKPMTFDNYDYGNGCKFKPTPAQRDELDIREVPRPWGNGKERRAFNVKLWNQLQAVAKKKRKERAETKEAARNDEATANREQQAAADKARTFGRALYRYRIDWIQRQIAVRTGFLTPDAVLKSLLILMTNANELDETIGRALGVKISYPSSERICEALLKLPDSETARIAKDVLIHVLQEETRDYGYQDSRILPADWVMHLADELGIDFPKEWSPSVAFIALYSVEQRKKLTASWDPAPADLEPDSVLAVWPKGFVPDELLFADETGSTKRPRAKKAKARS